MLMHFFKKKQINQVSEWLWQIENLYEIFKKQGIFLWKELELSILGSEEVVLTNSEWVSDHTCIFEWSQRSSMNRKRIEREAEETGEEEVWTTASS